MGDRRPDNADPFVGAPNDVRVIAGEAKGRKLKGPPSSGTRPMADRIKGALYSMLGSLGVEPQRVLDLYAGTGSVGIEALSRGAVWADFVDQNAAACAVVRSNLVSTKFDGVSRVHQMAVASFLARNEQPYDFVILDPPYADPAIVETLEKVADSRLVQSGTIVVIGHASNVQLPDQLSRLDRLRHRCHGDSCLSIYDVVEIDAATADQAGDRSIAGRSGT